MLRHVKSITADAVANHLSISGLFFFVTSKQNPMNSFVWEFNLLGNSFAYS